MVTKKPIEEAEKESVEKPEQHTIDPVKVYEYKVFYKKNPEYVGSFNADLGSGLHGIFDNLARAQDEAKKCRAWFREERTNMNMKDGWVQKEGAPDDIRLTVHDNVIVWIEEWVDGVKQTKGKTAA